jgi:hypothetical protein
MSRVGFEREIAEFIDDQQLGLAEVRQAIFEPGALASWATKVGAGTNSTV